jgi:hypothetical protein
LPTANSPKTGGKGFADCFTRGSRQRTRGKEFIGKETFATCQEESSRQSLCHPPYWQSAKGTYAVMRFFADCLCWQVAKDSLPTAFVGRWQRILCQLPLLAGGKGRSSYFSPAQRWF